MNGYKKTLAVLAGFTAVCGLGVALVSWGTLGGWFGAATCLIGATWVVILLVGHRRSSG